MHRLARSIVFVALAAIVSVGAIAPAGAAEKPERIVSLSATATEMLFAIGAGDQVVAVDEYSTYPEEAPITDLSGYPPNIEAIAGYQPDLVVLPDEAAVDGLAALDIETLVLPAAADLDETYAQLKKLGKVTGHRSSAKQVVKEIKADIADLVEQVPDGPKPTAYYELDDTYFSADSSSFIGQLLELGGFANIADEAGVSDAAGYPQLSSEFIVDSDPDVIFLADTECCGQNAQTIAARPGFSELKAVTEGHVIELSDDLASRWGPRVVELLRTIVKARSEL